MKVDYLFSNAWLLSFLLGLGFGTAGLFVAGCSTEPYALPPEAERVIVTGTNVPTFTEEATPPSSRPSGVDWEQTQSNQFVERYAYSPEIQTYVSKNVFPFLAQSTSETTYDVANGSPPAREPSVNGAIERVPHLKVSSASNSDLIVSVYADIQHEQSGEKVKQRIHMDVPDYVSECKLNVWLDVSSNLSVRRAIENSIIITRSAPISTFARFMVNINPDAARDEECFFTAYLSYNGRPAGRVERRAKLGDIEKLFVPARSETVTFQPAAPQPDITITVLNPKKNNIELECRIQSSLLDDYKEGITETWYLQQNTGDLVTSFFGDFLTASSYHDRYETLLGGGKKLYKMLPPKCKAALWNLTTSNARTLLIVSQEPFIPWELMIPTKRFRDRHLEEQPPLGVRFAIGRWVLDDEEYYSPPANIKVNGSYVIAPIYVGSQALDAAHDEAKFVCDNFAGTAIVPANPTTIEEKIKSKEQSLLHFVCHGSIDGVRVGRQILELQDNTYLDSMRVGQMEGLQAGFSHAKPFVFINACTAGRPILTLSGIGGLANSFIELGASAIVAPLWNIDDKIAHDVAVNFYSAVKTDPKCPLAEIVRRIRRKAYDDPKALGQDTYTAYCFYGDPYATISYTPEL
jgi:hypothetical protein